MKVGITMKRQGRTMMLELACGATVADALAAAGLTPVDGDLIAVIEGKVVGRDAPLSDGDTLCILPAIVDG